MTKIQRINSAKTVKCVVDGLRKKGYRKIGCGAFADVFGSKRRKTVIKVGILETSWNSYTRFTPDGYLTFAKKAMLKKYSTNPWLPRIYSIKVIEYPLVKKQRPNYWNKYIWGYYIIEIEKLYHIKNEKATDELRHAFYTSNRLRKKGWKYLVNPAQDKKLIQALTLIRECIKMDRTYEPDVHLHNVMKRQNGQYVFTDPVA